MHNASIPTLADVVRHYENGGIDRPGRARLMVPIRLSDQERLNLVAFLESLAGEAARPGR
jgi:cytochrome c peroxidase